MLDTAFANLGFAISMVTGRPFRQRSLEALLASAKQTQHEFGRIGSDAEALLVPPPMDPGALQAVQERRFRAQAIEALETPYYRERFNDLNISPRATGMNPTDFPITSKNTLRDRAEDFVSSRSRPQYRSTTTGTTGWPTTIWFSEYENFLIGALSTITFRGQRIIEPDDFIQIAISTRARLGVHGVTFAANQIGAPVHPAGIVSPEHTLALLTERHKLPGKKSRVSVMSTYPSYLGELVECALALGYKASDFGLERLLLGGEILSAGMQRRATELFGEIEFRQNYGMTELVPYGASLCEVGHLHYEPTVGLLEVMDIETCSRMVRPGEAGVVVATPLPPFRDTTILLRYNTEDVVRTLEGPVECSLRSVPGTTNLLGKARLSIQHDSGWTFVRDVLDALESVDDVVLPARYGFAAVPGGVAVEVVARSTNKKTADAIGDSLERHGVPLRRLRVVDIRDDLLAPLPLRCDLREGSLATLRKSASIVGAFGGMR